MTNASAATPSPTQAADGDAAPAPQRVVVVVAQAGSTVEASRTLPAVHPADTPLLLADDLAAVRGDGVFDSLLYHRGRVLKMERHLDRIAKSAQMLDLTAPTSEQWRAGLELAVQEWQRVAQPAGDGAGHAPDALMRLVLTRGPEHLQGAQPGSGEPSAYITVAPTSTHLETVRREGIAVQTQQRGFAVDLAAAAPWQLLGAKTVSYATNMAALRHASAQGFDDVLFLSAEGEVLEGPRSTVVIERDGELLSPPAEIGILPGTTLEAVAELAQRRGIAVRREHLLVTDVLTADSAWFISSITLAARITKLDEHPLVGRSSRIDIGQLVAEAVGYEEWPG